MQLQGGVMLDLRYNHIGDEKIKLFQNKISKQGKAILQKWRDDARARGIDCEVEF